MLKQYLRLPGEAVWLTGLLVVSLLVTACGGATEPANVASPAADTETAAVTPTAAETEITEKSEAQAEEVTEVEEAEATEASETDAAAEATEEENLLADASAALVECETLDIPDNNLIAAVSEQDWVKGPANAPVTLIEYGDYQ